ncbi:MAG: hypothetical protein KW802_02960 [Candidatus Doudnabacteria bacterium]|nr:hypothetical protein [Candidatus Doudnabacteria bacterium]
MSDEVEVLDDDPSDLLMAGGNLGEGHALSSALLVAQPKAPSRLAKLFQRKPVDGVGRANVMATLIDPKRPGRNRRKRFISTGLVLAIGIASYQGIHLLPSASTAGLLISSITAKRPAASTPTVSPEKSPAPNFLELQKDPKFVEFVQKMIREQSVQPSAAVLPIVEVKPAKVEAPVIGPVLTTGKTQDAPPKLVPARKSPKLRVAKATPPAPESNRRNTTDTAASGNRITIRIALPPLEEDLRKAGLIK